MKLNAREQSDPEQEEFEQSFQRKNGFFKRMLSIFVNLDHGSDRGPGDIKTRSDTRHNGTGPADDEGQKPYRE